MKTFFKIVRNVVQILLLLLLIPAVFVVVTSRTEKIFNIRSMVVLTGSMEPRLPVGSVIVTRPINIYNIGDIVSFKNDSDLTITHRIVEGFKDEKGVLYKVKGDANNTSDQDLVRLEQILGKEVLTLPYIGKIIGATKSPKGFISLIIVPAFVFIVLELIGIKNELEKEYRKKMLKELGVA